MPHAATVRCHDPRSARAGGFVAARRTLLVALAATAGGAARSQAPARVDGFLCCNMLSDGSWISDINYVDSSKKLIPAGTPVTVTGEGRWRLLAVIDGQNLALGNDYSRTLSMEQFQQRYVVAKDPRPKLKAMPPRVREAIAARRVLKGMTREQVLMSLGYPVTSYTENLDAPLWRYWYSRSEEFQVFWSAQQRVERLFGTPDVRAKVWME